MADLSVVDLTTAPAEYTWQVAASGGDKIPNVGGKVIVLVRNTNAAARTVTLAAQETSITVPGVGVATVADKVLNLAQNEHGAFILPERGFRNSADSNKAAITYDSEVGVEFMVFRIV